MSYKEAVELIRSLNVPVWSVTNGYRSMVPDMINFLHRVGYTVPDLAKLNIIHVTGTKGKGSTLTFCESILRHHGVRTGAYISPHLVTLRERYRLDGEPVSKDIFAHHVFELFQKLQNTKESETDMPFRFAFMTLLAFDMFLKQGVEALVLEVGIGGEYDCTNVIGAPVVCGVSSIHLDHVLKLGNTVESIAWHKSGIFKPGAPAVTVPQTHGILPVLQSRAAERGTLLIMAPPLDEYETQTPIELGLAGHVQRENASLALQLCKIWKETVKSDSPSKIFHNESQTKDEGIKENRMTVEAEIRPNLELTANELKAARSRGRTQIIRRDDVTYFLDTAHTDISIQRLPFDVALFCPAAVDKESRVESLYTEATEEEQMCWTTEAFEQWQKLDKNNQPENDEGQCRVYEIKGDHSHIPTLSFIVQSLKQALALATCGRDGGVFNRDVTQHVSEQCPAVIRSADQVQVMIAGGHKIVGHSLSYLET